MNISKVKHYLLYFILDSNEWGAPCSDRFFRLTVKIGDGLDKPLDGRTDKLMEVIPNISPYIFPFLWRGESVLNQNEGTK